MPLSQPERDSLTRQLFEAIATVGFLKWKRDFPNDAEELLAQQSAEEVKAAYVQVFEKVTWDDIKEMARRTPDGRLCDTLSEWRDRAEAACRHDAKEGKISPAKLRQTGATPMPRAKARDTGMDR